MSKRYVYTLEVYSASTKLYHLEDVYSSYKKGVDAITWRCELEQGLVGEEPIKWVTENLNHEWYQTHATINGFKVGFLLSRHEVK